MNKGLFASRWNPYLAGALVGLLAVVSVAATQQLLGKAHYLGASTTFVRVAGFVEGVFAPEHVAANALFQKEKIKLDWQMMMVGGILVGALLSARMGRTFRLESVPPVWRDRFGGSVTVRAIGGFAGGVLAIIGARLANGCPSGHGLSGVMQLSISGLVALVGFIVGGMLVARLVYRR